MLNDDVAIYTLMQSICSGNNLLPSGIKCKTHQLDNDVAAVFQTHHYFNQSQNTPTRRHTRALSATRSFSKLVTFSSRVVPVVAPHMSRWTSRWSSRCCVDSHAIFASIVTFLVAFFFYLYQMILKIMTLTIMSVFWLSIIRVLHV